MSAADRALRPRMWLPRIYSDPGRPDQGILSVNRFLHQGHLDQTATLLATYPVRQLILAPLRQHDLALGKVGLKSWACPTLVKTSVPLFSCTDEAFSILGRIIRDNPQMHTVSLDSGDLISPEVLLEVMETVAETGTVRWFQSSDWVQCDALASVTQLNQQAEIMSTQLVYLEDWLLVWVVDRLNLGVV